MTTSFALRLADVTVIAAVFTLFGACGSRESETPVAPTAPVAEVVVPALAERAYTVGTDAAYPPFEYLTESGVIVGFDIELVQALANRAGFTVKFVNTPWEALFWSLAQGELDLLASAMTITDERKLTMDFSDPYFITQQLIAVKDGSRATKFTDLARLRVGVQFGTLGDEVVTKLLGANNPKIKRFESTAMALTDLEAGGIDAVVGDSGVLMHHKVRFLNSKLKTIADPELIPRHYAIAVRKGRSELLGRVNAALAEIKLDGSYDTIYVKYFGRQTDQPLFTAAPHAASAPATAVPVARQ